MTVSVISAPWCGAHQITHSAKGRGCDSPQSFLLSTGRDEMQGGGHFNCASAFNFALAARYSRMYSARSRTGLAAIGSRVAVGAAIA